MKTLCERLWPRIKQMPSGCWEWQGAKSDGYGHIKVRGKVWLVHRLVYQFLVGPLDQDLTIDHLCRNHGCCNPRHLEQVTHRKNVLRGEAPAARQARQTHCSRGHEFDTENTYYSNGGRKRACIQCRRAVRMERRHSNV